MTPHHQVRPPQVTLAAVTRAKGVATRRQIMQIVAATPNLSAQQIADRIGLTYYGTHSALRRLVACGALAATGTPARYVLARSFIDEGAP